MNGYENTLSFNILEGENESQQALVLLLWHCNDEKSSEFRVQSSEFRVVTKQLSQEISHRKSCHVMESMAKEVEGMDIAQDGSAQDIDPQRIPPPTPA